MIRVEHSLRTRLAPHWLPLVLYLGVVATAGMLLLQAIAQRQVPADKAAVVYAMEPVFAALFGWLWLNEVLSNRAALGGAMVVVAVLVSELKPGQDAFGQAKRQLTRPRVPWQPNSNAKKCNPHRPVWRCKSPVQRGRSGHRY